MSTSWYEILGLDTSAGEEEIKKAYKKLAMKYHPDRNPGDAAAETKFKEVKEAYEMLTDPIKRQQYEQAKAQEAAHANGGFHHGPFGHHKTWTFNGGAGPGDDFFSIFGDLFEQHRRAQPGAHTQPKTIYQINLSLEDAARGPTLKVDEKTTINVPKGVRDGTRFFINDKIYQVHVQPHHKFKRSNDDLLVDIEVDVFEALLGLDATLALLDGTTVKFKIPAGVGPGSVVKIAGKGMNNPEVDRPGDMLVRCNVVMPKTLTDAQRELLPQLVSRKIINI